MFKRAVVLIASLACAVAVMLLAAPARAGGTLLLAKSEPNAPSDAELPLERTDVELDVAGSIVGATVTQRFKNTYAKPIEVVYLFPLAQNAAVDAMEMKIGTRTITGSVARREEARTAYAAAVRDGRRAALLEQERPNMFTFSVGNIDAGATIDVKLHYFEVAGFDHGTYEVVVPTTIGPRFTPSGVKDAARITTAYVKGGARIGIHAKIDGGTPIESIETPAWETTIGRTGANTAEVKLKNADDAGNRDFILRWRLKAESFEPAVFAYKSNEDPSGYLTLMLEPKHAIVPSEIAPRELIFLLDTSGSMRGAPLAAATAAVNKAIDKLGPNDTFQIIDFADKASTFADRPLDNTPLNRKRGHDYIHSLRSSGGTNQLVGIHAALATPGDARRTRYVVFMTDGFIGNDAEVIALTRKEIGKARIFSFGVGSNVNRYLLDEVAIAARGYAEYLRPSEKADEMIDRFYNRIGMPYLTDVDVDWGGLAVTDPRPAALPDLSALQPLVLHARYMHPGEGDITIKGRIAGKPVTQKVHLTLPANAPEHGALEKLWARATIAELERVPRGKPVPERAVADVAVTHGLMSKYTAFVATDSTGPKDADGKPQLVQQPGEVPADVDIAQAGGTMYNSGAALAAPSPPREEASYSVKLAEAPSRAGGCAGCTTAPSPVSTPAIAALGALGLLIVVRRRRG